eukprot:CAMPEP_0176159292 /NCGR_PEP_ID=MMETSP0120_2-20121206/81485_1 /TAXON_ID=160619 /ORGANISM="Kryptoperidinium foliaceum, Strain CCMP 1326" /LENGTH=252 /DNA_ID=CAMNT_0017496703 /DNA_START=23 /DNA_END=782 /DNA_ORIENTATION=-
MKFSCLLLVLPTSSSLQLGNFFGGIKPPSMDVLGGSPMEKTKEELLAVISNTGNGKNADIDSQRQALRLVSFLESNAPVPDNLLRDPKTASALDGVWYLQYTAPSDIDIDDMPAWNPEDSTEGDAKIDTRKANIQGSVRAGGLTVDTSIGSNQRIENRVEQDFGIVTVGGSFRVSDTVANRAVVAFEEADIALNNGFVLKLGFLFSIIALLRGGIKDNGWLETTYIDDAMRIGRGNKGSLFVLTRDRDAVQP